MLTNDRNRLGGRDVVARVPIIVPRGAVEIFLNNLFSTRKSVTPAHWEIMADREIAVGVRSLGKRSGMYTLAKDKTRSHGAHNSRYSR